MPQSQPWQQSDFSDMQLLQQQVMLKQMQEMQRQQQFQSFTDTRQHSGMLKNVDGVQCSPIINGTPVHGTSNMFTNWGHQGGSASVQGMSQFASAQDQRSAFGVDGVQPYGGSSYDSPVTGAGSNLNQIYFQGISGGSPMQQHQQPVAQSLGLAHSFSGGQHLPSSNQAFSSRQDYSRSNIYGQVHQNLNQDNTFGSLQHASVLPKNATAYEINENEQSGWPSNQLDNKSKHIPSQGSATLDPLEEKLLFSMDDNLWDISSGKVTEVGAGNSGNALGSWSALMQSALAETSSGDTGLQEEWSGVTFQNTDPSVDNQTSNFVESGHLQAECGENGMQPASALSMTEYQYLNSPGMNFPGFRQAVPNNQYEQDRSLHSSHEHSQLLSQTGGRFESNHQQSSQTVGKQQLHGWASPSYVRAESNPTQLHLAASDQKTNNTDFWSEQKAHSGTSNAFAHNNVLMNKFPSGLDSRTSLVSAEAQKQENNQLAYAYQTNTPDLMRDGGTMANQHTSNNKPQAFDRSSMHSNSNSVNLSGQGRPETNLSNAIDNSMIFHASNASSQQSQNALRLFQNINQSRAEVHGNSLSQRQSAAAAEAKYSNQSPSQGSSFLPSPTQRYPDHNIMHTSQNSWQNSGNPVISSSVPNHSQLHWQQISRSSVGSQPIQTALFSAATRHANAIASSHRNSSGPTHANTFPQQYTTLGERSTSQPSMAYNTPQEDVLPSKPANQWTDVPVQKHPANSKSELVQGSSLSHEHVKEMFGYPQHLNELETKDLTLSGSSAKPVIKHEEEKTQPHILSEAQPEFVFQHTSEKQEPVENEARHFEKNSSMNQMNILYGNQGDTVWSTNAAAITRPNKRKSRTSELLPWHKEMAKISITFPETRTSEEDWSRATNQLMEVTNEAELLKYGRALIRPRKRLILTTKLVQTLLRPAPRTILSKNAASAYDSVTCIVARLSLGDACNMSSARAKTDLASKSDKEEKSNLDKVLENFSKRTKRLEDVLQRSEEIPSVVDINVEYQDLERFSVINRFAKFHSRAQPNPSESFSQGPPKMYPQRYVSAFPMPKEIPDGLPCISL